MDSLVYDETKSPVYRYKVFYFACKVSAFVQSFCFCIFYYIHLNEHGVIKAFRQICQQRSDLRNLKADPQVWDYFL